MAQPPPRKTFQSVEVTQQNISLKFTATNEAPNQKAGTSLDVTFWKEIPSLHGESYSTPLTFTLPQWAIEEIASYANRFLTPPPMDSRIRL
jgi:hypothetical protein